MNQPLSSARVYTIILNWNGWRDTIECLRSVQELTFPDTGTIVVDNGSADDSVMRIRDWATKAGIHLEERDYSRALGFASTTTAPPRGEMLLIRSSDNLGFAAGCNVGIRLAAQSRCRYVWLLNNDTVVTPESLGKLVGFLEEHGEYVAGTGQIRYHATPDRVWNCGGDLLPLGMRRYHHCHAHVSQVPQSGFTEISFMTGCAALLRMTTLGDIGLLTEEFFFGEEDFELSQRLQRRHLKMVCRNDSIIYHKVGASISDASSKNVLAKVYVYYLNRFIHMRRYWPDSLWKMWRLVYSVYIVNLLARTQGLSVRRGFSFVRRLIDESNALRGVDEHRFREILASEQFCQ